MSFRRLSTSKNSSLRRKSVKKVSKPLKYLNRPSWDNTFMDITLIMAKRSTCQKIKTASIIVKDNRCISTGYNGSPPKERHCIEHWRNFHNKKYKAALANKMENIPLYISNSTSLSDSYQKFIETDDFKAAHHEWSKSNEQHAELNAILYAAKIGQSTQGTTLYTILAPCYKCATSMINVGITRLVYKLEYLNDTKGLNFLKKQENFEIKKLE